MKDASPGSNRTDRMAGRLLAAKTHGLTTRSTKNRIVGGVCAGIAETYGLDVAFVRSLAVVSCFVGGAGFVAYPLALVLLPAAPGADDDDLAPEHGDDPLVLWGGLILVGLGAFLASLVDGLRFELFSLSLGSLVPGLLGAAGLLIAKRRSRDDDGREPRRLVRPVTDRLVFGLASGLSRYIDIEPNLLRLLLAVVAVWSRGLIVLLYLAVTAFVPEEPTSPE